MRAGADLTRFAVFTKDAPSAVSRSTAVLRIAAQYQVAPLLAAREGFDLTREMRLSIFEITAMR
jgi:hypothetical protein